MKPNIGISLLLGLALTLILLGSLSLLEPQPPLARANSLTVCIEGPPVCDYAGIQAAVDAAGAGDLIKVAAGTYADVHVRPRDDITTTGVVTQVVYISKTVTVRGGYSTTNAFADPPDPEANPTTLNAGGQGRVIYITGAVSPTLEGLRITGGQVIGQPGDPGGGGVLVISATAIISDSQVFSNTTLQEGGGLALWHGNAVLSGNHFIGNVSSFGGGIFLSGTATLTGNIVASNTANYGGGVFLWSGSTATLRRNTITANSAAFKGGGVYWWSSDVTLNGNVVTANRAESGGGLYLFSCDATLINNVVADNQASLSASGVFIGYASARLLHNTIARNRDGQGSGIWVLGTPEPDQSVVTLTNSIVVSQSVGITVTGNSTVTLEATLWGSGVWANGSDWGGDGHIITGGQEIWGDPAFVAPNVGDYHISSNSVAIDHGVSAGVTFDMDGQSRPGGVGYDIGADEFHVSANPIYLPMVWRNG